MCVLDTDTEFNILVVVVVGTEMSLSLIHQCPSLTVFRVLNHDPHLDWCIPTIIIIIIVVVVAFGKYNTSCQSEFAAWHTVGHRHGPVGIHPSIGTVVPCVLSGSAVVDEAKTASGGLSPGLIVNGVPAQVTRLVDACQVTKRRKIGVRINESDQLFGKYRPDAVHIASVMA